MGIEGPELREFSVGSGARAQAISSLLSFPPGDLAQGHGQDVEQLAWCGPDTLGLPHFASVTPQRAGL